jgi:hypothetical protein
MASKYIPPALRAKMVAEAAATQRAEQEKEQPVADLQSWLRQAQRGYVAKTPEQIRQECLSMNYAQLRTRAGPPPNVTSDDYGGAWEQGGEGEGARVCALFDDDLRLYKQGRCPPPAPLVFSGRDDGDICAAEAAESGVAKAAKSAAEQRRDAYANWFSIYGERLRWLWAAEHPSAPVKKLPPSLRERKREEYKEPTRGQLAAAAAVSEKSGW